MTTRTARNRNQNSTRPRTRRPTRRGDNIPSVSDYAHWNEDAQRVWYEENRHDMEHADEIVDEGKDE